MIKIISIYLKRQIEEQQQLVSFNEKTTNFHLKFFIEEHWKTSVKDYLELL